MKKVFDESKSHEEIIENAKDLKDFGTGHQQPKVLLTKDMPLRDYFASQVLGGIVMKFGLDGYKSYVRDAYQIADAMLKVRNENE